MLEVTKTVEQEQRESYPGCSNESWQVDGFQRNIYRVRPENIHPLETLTLTC